MPNHCVICFEPLYESFRTGGRLCVICAHRTTAVERAMRRPRPAGLIDMA